MLACPATASLLMHFKPACGRWLLPCPLNTGAIVRCDSTDAAVNANLVLRANNAREELPRNPLEIDLTPAHPEHCSPIKRLHKWPMKHVDSLTLDD
jgi:hypothetical protein